MGQSGLALINVSNCTNVGKGVGSIVVGGESLNVGCGAGAGACAYSSGGW